MKEIPANIFTASRAVEERMAEIQYSRLASLKKPVPFTGLREGMG